MNTLPIAEDNRTEFKAELTENLEKEVVAFLNYKEGGYIYIGISDNGSVCGIDDPDTTQLRIVNRIKDNISPSTLGLFDIETHYYDEKSYLKIIISSGPEKPYYLIRYGMSPRGCYLRVGTSMQ